VIADSAGLYNRPHGGSDQIGARDLLGSRSHDNNGDTNGQPQPQATLSSALRSSASAAVTGACDVLASRLPMPVPECGQNFKEFHVAFPLPCNDLAPLRFGGRNALCSYVNTREQPEGRPNLILNFGCSLVQAN